MRNQGEEGEREVERGHPTLTLLQTTLPQGRRRGASQWRRGEVEEGRRGRQRWGGVSFAVSQFRFPFFWGISTSIHFPAARVGWHLRSFILQCANVILDELRISFFFYEFFIGWFLKTSNGFLFAFLSLSLFLMQELVCGWNLIGNYILSVDLNHLKDFKSIFFCYPSFWCKSRSVCGIFHILSYWKLYTLLCFSWFERLEGFLLKGISFLLSKFLMQELVRVWDLSYFDFVMIMCSNAPLYLDDLK